MARYRCTVCNFVYDEEKEGKKFSELPDDWRCPVCGAPKSAFVLLSEAAAEAKPAEATTVSDVLVQQMVEWGVQYVFGMPGTSSLGVVNAVRKSPKLTYIQVRHEQTAAFMASSYGKLTGHLAACLTIAGPGATNLATGLYDAKLDHSPVLALTGLVERQAMGPGAPQEIDQHSFFEPICVFNKILMSENQTTTLTTLAIKHALVERGVSHIAIPNDVQKLPCKAKVLPFEGRMPNMAFSQCEAIIQKAATLIDGASRPVVIAGFGTVGHGPEVAELARRISAPVVTTFRAKGVVDEHGDYNAGIHGSLGSTASAQLVRKSDLLIVIGSSYSDMTMIPEKRTVQIDIDPMMIAKKYPVDVGLLGNVAEVVPRLTDLVHERADNSYLDEIRQLKDAWRKTIDSEADPVQKPLRPPYIMKVLHDKLSPDAVIATDVGEHCWWFGRNFLMRDTQRYLLSGYLGSMGSGLPAAMAAALAYPGRQIVGIVGDGGFSLVMGDFETVVKYEMPVKIFLLNNRQLGMIQQEQKMEGYPLWGTDLCNCDFARFAEDCGGVGISVSEPAELPGAVDEALKQKKPVIVDIETDPRRFV
jgi:pyruvate oxidase/acetolactate synthase-1/2/3 large subunit